MNDILISLTILLFAIATGFCKPYQSGQPGGEWSGEEIDIVKEKILQMLKCAQKAQIGGGYAGRSSLQNCIDSNGKKCYSRATNVTQSKELLNESKKGLDCWRVEGLPDDLLSKDLPNKYSPDKDMFGPQFSLWSIKKRPNANSRRWFFDITSVSPAKLIQFAFHDCLKYKHGGGGCDGCINWSGMGNQKSSQAKSKNQDGSKKMADYPIEFHTTNNKLQMTARSLELIYKVPNWPPGARSLSMSLKDSGKSRADLWQLAGNVGLEEAIKESNEHGHINNTPVENMERFLCAMEGKEGCLTKLDRPIPFRTGRRDCIPDPDKKSTPYDFEATEEEVHSNPHGTGIQVVKDLKKDFNLTARETLALFATHGLNYKSALAFTEGIQYKWIGGSVHNHWNPTKGTFSNMYFKILAGKRYQMGRGELNEDVTGDFVPDYIVGDKNGNPVGKGGFQLQCSDYWPRQPGKTLGGPCLFRPVSPGGWPEGPNSNQLSTLACFIRTEYGWQIRWDKVMKGIVNYYFNGDFDKAMEATGCDKVEPLTQLIPAFYFFLVKNASFVSPESYLVRREDGFIFQRGPVRTRDWRRDRGEFFATTSATFAMAPEVGFIMDFDVDKRTNLPTGCGPLDFPSKGVDHSGKKGATSTPFYPGSPIVYQAGLSWGDSSRNPFNNTEAPPCPRVSYAPEGESLADIVELFADDHRTWQKELFNGWEKIQMNGYDPKELKISPANGNLLGVKEPIELPKQEPRVLDMSFETIVTFESLPRPWQICKDTKSKEWCKTKRPCGTERWLAQQKCMATCGFCPEGERIPCKNNDKSDFCSTVVSTGLCDEANVSTAARQAKFRCAKTCGLCLP